MFILRIWKDCMLKYLCAKFEIKRFIKTRENGKYFSKFLLLTDQCVTEK